MAQTLKEKKTSKTTKTKKASKVEKAIAVEETKKTETIAQQSEKPKAIEREESTAFIKVSDVQGKWSEKYVYARHGKEGILFIFVAAFNLFCYFLISYFSVKAATDDNFREALKELTGLDSDILETFVAIGGYAVILLIIYIIIQISILNRSFVGKSSITDVRLSDSKYNFLYIYYVETCKKYGLKKIPIVYLSDNQPNSEIFGMKIRSEKGISIPTKVVRDAAIKNDYSYCEYIICRRLAHIVLGYNNIVVQLLTIWTNLIPPLRKAIERIRCYSIDKTISLIIGKEQTAQAIFDENYKMDLYGNDTVEQVARKKLHCNGMEEFGRFVQSFEEEKPYPFARIEAIFNEKDGRIFY